MHCRDHVVQLHRARERIDATGGKVVLIGMAGARQAAWFRKKMDVDFPLLADDERVSYRAVGAKKGGAAELVGPSSVLKGIGHAVRSGQVQGRPVGDVSQLGAVVVVAPDGSVVFEHRARNAGDNVGPDKIVSALEKAARPPRN